MAIFGTFGQNQQNFFSKIGDMFINMVGICFTADFIKKRKFGLKSQILAQNSLKFGRLFKIMVDGTLEKNPFEGDILALYGYKFVLDVKCILGWFNWVLRMINECNLVPYNSFVLESVKRSTIFHYLYLFGILKCPPH